MLVSSHVIAGVLFSLVLFLIFPHIGLLYLLIIFLSSVLIDVDHYVYYIFNKKDMSLTNSYKHSMKQMRWYFAMTREKQRKVFHGFFLFHGFEFIILLLVLGWFVSNIFLYIFIGVIFHLFLDNFYEGLFAGRLDKISSIYELIRSRDSSIIRFKN